MRTTRTTRLIGRTLRDMLLGFGLFMGIALVGAANAGTSLGSMLCNAAEARALPADPYLVQGLPFANPSAIANHGHALVTAGIPAMPTMVMIGLVFGAMVAFDLWFYRHLRKAYVRSN